MDNKRWRILGIISTVLLIVISTFQVVDWIGKKSSKISSVISFDDFFIPSHIHEKFNYTSFSSFDSKVEIQIDSFVKYPDSRYLADSIKKIARQYFEDSFLSDKFSYKQIIRLEITSSSKEKVKGLHIELDGDGLCQIYTQEDKIKVSNFDHLIKLDDLRPENTITVLIWPKDRISSPNVKVIYEGGVQKPKLERKVSGYLLTLDKWGTAIYILIPLLIFFVWLQFLLWKKDTPSDVGEKDTQPTHKEKKEKKKKKKKKKKSEKM